MDLRPDQVYATLTSASGSIVFGAVDEFGVDWSLEALDGWAGGTGSTADTVQKPRQSGAWRGSGFAMPRSVAMEGGVFAPSADLLSSAFDRLNSVLPVGSDAVLRVTEAGRTRWALVRRGGAVITEWLMPTMGHWSLRMESSDWRKFGDDVGASTTLPSTFGGLVIGGGADDSAQTSFSGEQFTSMANKQGMTTNTAGQYGSMELYNPDGSRSDRTSLAVTQDTGDALTVSFTIDAVTVTGQVSLENPGNETGPVRLRIDGPCRGPVVTHVSTGAQLVFASSLVLGPGEWIDVDMEARTVLANGQASRSTWITSRGWSGFTPGVNTWAFTAAAFDSAARLTVAATPAWK